MRALRLTSWKSEPVLMEVAKPEPGPGQVVIQVGGAGACHSDLHLMSDFDEGMLPWNPPFTSVTRMPAGCTGSAPGSVASSPASQLR